MVLPGFGWPTFHVQGCDCQAHSEVAQLFAVAEAPGAPPGWQGRGAQSGTIKHPWPDCRASKAPLPLVPVGWGWQGAVDTALRWPITLNTVLHLKNNLQLCVLFFIRGHQNMGKLKVSDSILAVRNRCFSITDFFHPHSNLFSVSVNPFTDILFIGYFRWFVVG